MNKLEVIGFAIMGISLLCYAGYWFTLLANMLISTY
jgi:hypothetical protein